jgi:hypothetical protein
MESAEYVAAKGSRLSNQEAQVYGVELEQINQAFGGLRPGEVVEAARDPSSPLHSAFEWDDAVAASQARLERANYIIRSVVVKHIKGRQEGPKRVQVEMRAFHNVVDDGDRAYKSLDEVRKDPHLRKQLLIKAFNELKSWERRYKQFEELTKITKFLDRLDIEERIEELA